MQKTIDAKCPYTSKIVLSASTNQTSAFKPKFAIEAEGKVIGEGRGDTGGGGTGRGNKVKNRS